MSLPFDWFGILVASEGLIKHPSGTPVKKLDELRSSIYLDVNENLQ